ncbi:hypothetical protein EON77_19580, partial [bacterium]
MKPISLTIPRLAVLGLALVSAAAARAQTNLLRVPVEATRSGETAVSRADAVARAFTTNAARLTQSNRAARARLGL